MIDTINIFMEKIEWPFEAGSFYITDVCNFTCSECVSYNFLPLKGYSKWEENEKYVEGFSKHIEFPWIEIMGGEPLLNPDLPGWLKGMREYNPNPLITLCTNGSRVPKTKNLYNLLREYRITLDISWHGYNWENIKKGVFSILENPRFVGNRDLKDVWIDDNDVEVFFNTRTQFTRASNFLKNEFHNSNPDKAHAVCLQRTCPDIREGKAYKCPFIPATIEASRQVPSLNLNPDVISQLEKYEPMSWHWSFEKKKAWLDIQDQSIPQCKFCPTKIDFIDYECSDKKNSSKKFHS